MNRIVFFGTESESALVLEKLIANNFDIVAIITKPDSQRGRGRKIDSPATKKVADANNIKCLQPDNLLDIQDDLHNIISLNSVKIGVLVSYGKIIPTSIINAFPKGIINIHPSLLPKYRGPSPIETAILNGDQKTGVSIMALSAQMDAGPIYIQTSVPLNDKEYSSNLYETLFNLGGDILVENFEKIANSEIKPTEQDSSRATYCQLLNKSEGNLNPATMTASECERRVRAFSKYPKTRIDFAGHNIIITKSHTEQYESKFGVKCADDKWLAIDELISPSSGKKMSAESYLNGLKPQA